MQDCGLRFDLLKPERVGSAAGFKVDSERGNNSPRRHWPQKAVAAQVATAASNGEFKSNVCTSLDSMVAVMGGRGGRLEDPGARLLTPLRTYRK